MLEMSVYEGIPHLLCPVVTDMKQAANALNWCVGEMERRYKLLSKMGVRNLAGYNKKIAEATERGEKIGNPFSLTPEAPEPLERLPHIVVVIASASPPPAAPGPPSPAAPSPSSTPPSKMPSM